MDRRTSAPPLAALSGVLLLSALMLGPASASAYDFEVSARSEGYGYQLRRLERDGVSFLNRRRYTQYLGLRVFNLLDPGQRAFAPGSRRAPALLTLHALLRFDTDFGGYVDHGDDAPEIQNNQLDLMLGALEGRNLLGHVDFTLGRQYDAELFDFFAFDGLRVRVWHDLRVLGASFRVYVESHGGIQVARAHPFSAAVFETDGTSDDGTGDAVSPTFGVAAGIDGPRWVQLRVAYRGTASSAVLPGGDGEARGWGVDQELLFAGLAVEVPVLGTRPQVGVRYNLLTGGLDDVQVAVAQRLGRRHELGVDLLRSTPHFDGDSIFNLFALEPYTEVGARYRVRLIESLAMHVRGGYRRFFVDELEGNATTPDAYNVALGGAWRSPRLSAGLELFYLGGHGGHMGGGDLDGTWTTPWTRLRVEGRVSVIHHDSDGPLSSDGINLGIQLGARVRLFEGIHLHALVEDNVSRYYRSALRVLGVIDVEVQP